MSTPKKKYADDIEYPESDGKPMAETDAHMDLIVDLKFALRNFFHKKKDVYVSGCLMMYYVEGDPTKSVSPDVFVVKGVPKGQRRTYKIWQEGEAPLIVIEVSSRKTKREDFTSKMELYAELGVKEYYIFNPDYPKRRKPFNAYRLAGNQYVEVLVTGGRVKSEVLGLELVDTGETLRLYNPKTRQFLATEFEESAARLNAEEALVEAQAEIARLREEVERQRKRG